MKFYLFSLLAGVLVGVIYSLLHVRSRPDGRADAVRSDVIPGGR